MSKSEHNSTNRIAKLTLHFVHDTLRRENKYLSTSKNTTLVHTLKEQ